MSNSGVSAIAVDSAGERKETEHFRTFLNDSTEQDLLFGIKKKMEAVLQMSLHGWKNYITIIKTM